MLDGYAKSNLDAKWSETTCWRFLASVAGVEMVN